MGGATVYHYDPEGQLDLASYRVANPESSPGVAQRSDEFHYDKLGNRMGSNYVASRGWMDFARRNNGLNQYLAWWNYSAVYHDDNIPPSDPPHPYVFPGNGVLMQDGWITAGFNALNQPVSMWSPAYPGGDSAPWLRFGYDPLGRCVKRWKALGDGTPVTAAIYYYYDGWNLIQEGSNGGTADRVYVHGGRVDEIVASWGNGQWHNHHYDARGHCIMLTSASGSIQEQYDYDAFGLPYVYQANGTLVPLKLGSPAGNRFLFTGREWLKEMRIYDYRNRIYQPELGRFLQPDPVGLQILGVAPLSSRPAFGEIPKKFTNSEFNLYRYCHNDPVNKSDPTGLDLIVMMSPESLWNNGMQGHTATISGNNADGWHLFEKQGGEGTTAGNRHERFATLEQFRSSGRGDGYTSATRIQTHAAQDQAMREYGEANYNKPYSMENENCASLSRGIAQYAGVSSETKYVNVLGSHIPVPRAVMSEAAKLGRPALSQIHSDGQRQKDDEAHRKLLNALDRH